MFRLLKHDVFMYFAEIIPFVLSFCLTNNLLTNEENNLPLG